MQTKTHKTQVMSVFKADCAWYNNMQVLGVHTIDRSSPIPLYRQIKDIILDEIKRDGLSPSLSERELVGRFRVSRAPVRQALKELSDEGYLYRQRGQGTFPVRGLKLNPPALQLGGLTKHLQAQGLATESCVLAAGRIAPPPDVAQKLELSAGSTVFWSSRTIAVAGNTLIWSRFYLDVPPTFSPTIKELEQVSGIFDILDSEPDLSLTMGEHTIYASSARSEDAEALGIAENDPVLITETMMYTREGRLEGFRKLVHPANDYKMIFTVSR